MSIKKIQKSRPNKLPEPRVFTSEHNHDRFVFRYCGLFVTACGATDSEHGPALDIGSRLHPRRCRSGPTITFWVPS